MFFVSFFNKLFNLFFIVLSRCDICVGGSTGLTENAGKDECGICNNVGNPLARKNCECGEETDRCNICREKTAPDWNGNQTIYYSRGPFTHVKDLFKDLSLLETVAI